MSKLLHGVIEEAAQLGTEADALKSENAKLKACLRELADKAVDARKWISEMARSHSLAEQRIVLKSPRFCVLEETIAEARRLTDD